MPLGVQELSFYRASQLCRILLHKSWESCPFQGTLKYLVFNVKKCSSSHLQTVLSPLKKRRFWFGFGFFFPFPRDKALYFLFRLLEGTMATQVKRSDWNGANDFQRFCDIFPVSVLILIFAFLAETCIHLYHVSRNSMCVNWSKVSLFGFRYQW